MANHDKYMGGVFFGVGAAMTTYYHIKLPTKGYLGKFNTSPPAVRAIPMVAAFVAAYFVGHKITRYIHSVKTPPFKTQEEAEAYVKSHHH